MKIAIAPDSFKEQLTALPEEYLAEYPVPYVMTLAGCTQSAAIDVRLPRSNGAGA